MVSKRDLDPAGNSQPEGTGVCYYVQAHYVMHEMLHATNPKYFDTVGEAESFVRRERNWPRASTNRSIDICEQSYAWFEGKRKMAVPVILCSVPAEDAPSYGKYSPGTYEPTDQDTQEWAEMPARYRFAKLQKQLAEMGNLDKGSNFITSRDNARQLPEERELTPEQEAELRRRRDQDGKRLAESMTPEERAEAERMVSEKQSSLLAGG